MRILILFGATVVVLMTLVLFIGWLLPETREGRAEASIKAPPDQVLAVIVDVETQPGWRDVDAVTRTENGWFEMTARGERIDFVADEMFVDRISLRFTSDAGYSGEWEARMQPVSGGTQITVVERTTVPSPLGRIIARLMFDPTAFATAYLADLKDHVEGR